MPVQNRQGREFISTQKTSDKHNQHKRLESAEATLTWHVGKYKIITPPEVHPQLIDHFQSTSGGVYVSCIYSHAR